MRGYSIHYDEDATPPLITLYLHHAPHKRAHRKVLQQYREDLLRVATRRIASMVDLPIDHPVELSVVFVNPTSPDLDHLIEALFMAMDGKSLRGPSVLKDDRHVQAVTMKKLYVSRSSADGVNR